MEQIVVQDLTAGFSRQPQHATSSSHIANHYINSESPTKLSQHLYKSKELEIAEKYEQALDANSLEGINKLFDAVLDIDLHNCTQKLI